MALVGVIAVTATIINPVTQLQKARDSQRKSDLKLLQSVLEFHLSDNDFYPATLPGCNNAFTDPTGLRAKYLDKMPCDPKDTTTSYNYSPTTKSGAACDNLSTTTICAKYTLYACLEYTSDTDRDQVNKCSNPRWSKTYSSP